MNCEGNYHEKSFYRILISNLNFCNVAFHSGDINSTI